MSLITVAHVVQGKTDFFDKEDRFIRPERPVVFMFERPDFSRKTTGLIV